MAKYIYAGANTDGQFRTELLLSFREPQIYFFSGKFAKTKNRIFFENPPKKVLDFVMKVQNNFETITGQK